MATKWQFTGDVSFLDYGGKWFRRTHARVYQVIELTNMYEACGSDNVGRPIYVVELSLVDLDAIDAKTQASALHSCGPSDGEEITDPWLAIYCYEYGARAPLESWEGNGSSKLLRAARSAAHTLARDASALAERMESKVNRIGSTAREYMTGDLNSAILRGVADGNPEAELMLELGMGR